MGGGKIIEKLFTCIFKVHVLLLFSCWLYQVLVAARAFLLLQQEGLLPSLRTRGPSPPFIPRAQPGPRLGDQRAGLGRGPLGPKSGIHLLWPSSVFPGKSRRPWPYPCPPPHHLLPVYLFILKSHLPTLPGAQNILASLPRGE